MRLASGVLLGVLFGASNASFVWATKTLAERLSTTEFATAPAEENRGSKDAPEFRQRAFDRADAAIQGALDLWLPRRGREMDWRQIVGGLLFLPALVAVRSVAGYTSAYYMGWVGERVVNDLRYDVLKKLSTLSLDFFHHNHSGELLTQIREDTAMLLRTLRAGFADLIKETVSIVSLFTILWLMDWRLTLFSMVFLPACLLPVIIFGNRARRASKASRKASISQFSQLVELVSNIRVVKAFNLEKTQLDRFRESSRQIVRQGVKGIQAKESVNPAIELISTVALGVLLVFLFATGRTVSDLVGFLTGLLLFYTPVKRLAGIHILMEQTSVSVQRLMSTLNEEPTLRDPAHPKVLKGFSDSIVFDRVTFAYRDEPVLRDVSLELPRGFKLGVAGASGSGKSTIVNLLLRFYDPTSGAIRIDGVDLREMSQHGLRELMALVSQEVILFDLTIAENIALGRPGATEAEIRAAAEAAFASEFIERLPEGYNTRIGERGVTLSGGQRQRLAIARAFVRNAPILVLDEATAALDAQSEAVVQAAIENLEQNRTVICVAHRLSTLTNMDQVIMLSEGRIVEKGTFAELLEARGAFAAMARMQGILPPVAA
jgi:ABC-type multidrug transport system fused ATPase/permease subunit